MDDRRRGVPRRDFGLPVRYWSATDAPPFDGRTVNISPGGMFIRTDDEAPRNGQLQIEVELPGREPMLILAQVAWIRRIPTHFRNEIANGFGLQIIQAPEEWYRLFLYSS